MTTLPTDGRSITYQLQYRKCGNPACHCRTGKGHGPYWYAYWHEGKKQYGKYIGKNAPVRPEPDQPALAPEPASV